jgi:hypothetical protein
MRTISIKRQPVIVLHTIWRNTETMIDNCHPCIVPHPSPRFLTVYFSLTKYARAPWKKANVCHEAVSNLRLEFVPSTLLLTIVERNVVCQIVTCQVDRQFRPRMREYLFG